MISGSRNDTWHVFTTLLVLALALFGLSPAHAESQPWQAFRTTTFDIITTADGLPHPVTTALVQDSHGLIWIGTKGGLARFDGINMRVFKTRGGGDSTLPDSYVRCLLALADGDLLIGTNNGGLARFHADNGHFSTWPVDKTGTGARKIRAMATDHNGGAWLATGQGLAHLDLASGRITHISPDSGLHGQNYSVFQDNAGNLWLGNANGLLVRHHGTTRFVRPEIADPALRTAMGTIVWSMAEGSSGTLWFGTVRSGVVYRNPDGSWHGLEGLFSTPEDMQRPTVRDILTTPAGDVWVATDGNGIAHVSSLGNGLQHIHYDMGVAVSLPGNRTRALLRDRSGNIWVATNNGAAHINPAQRPAFIVKPTPGNPKGLSGNIVNTIYVDDRQRIWLGLERGHVDILELGTGRARHVVLKGQRAQHDIQAFLEMPEWLDLGGIPGHRAHQSGQHGNHAIALATAGRCSRPQPGAPRQRRADRHLCGRVSLRYGQRRHATHHPRWRRSGQPDQQCRALHHAHQQPVVVRHRQRHQHR